MAENRKRLAGVEYVEALGRFYRKLNNAVRQEELSDIRKTLEDSKELVDRWLTVKDDLVIKPVHRTEIESRYYERQSGSISDAIALTLNKWHSRGPEVSNRVKLIEIIKEYDSRTAEALDEMFWPPLDGKYKRGRKEYNWNVMPKWILYEEELAKLEEKLEPPIAHATLNEIVQHFKRSDFKSITLASENQAFLGAPKNEDTISGAFSYAKAYEEEYDHIIWLDSKDRALKTSFKKLGKKLDLTCSSTASFDSFVQSIYKKLDRARCLFIFDNAEVFDGENSVINFLPRNDFHHSIITTARTSAFLASSAADEQKVLDVGGSPWILATNVY